MNHFNDKRGRKGAAARDRATREEQRQREEAEWDPMGTLTDKTDFIYKVCMGITDS